MSDVHSAVAMRLAALSSEDRQWLLSQLGDNDRARLLLLLQQRAEPSDRSGVPDTRPKKRYYAESDDHAVVDSAEVDIVARLLENEPDWIVAVLLAHAEWRWADAFMSACSPTRLQRITAAMKAEAQVVKPRVHQAVVSSLAQKLQHRPRAAHELSAFERMLDRAERRLAEAFSHGKEEV